MQTVKIENDVVRVIFTDTGKCFGFYRSRPGFKPYICLNPKLIEFGIDEQFKVYRALLDYHHSIPPDSCRRLFPIMMLYEKLIEGEINDPEVMVFHKICGIMATSKIAQKDLGIRVVGRR
jgi:hypothetical protein